MVLIFVGIIKKDKILSDTALNRLKINQGSLKQIFYLGLVAMAIFIVDLSTEFIEVWRQVSFHTLYPGITEMVKVSLVTVIIIMNILNLKLVFLLVRSGE
jgi:hypothetical protein